MGLLSCMQAKRKVTRETMRACTRAHVPMQVLKGLPALSLGQLAHDPQHAQHVSALPMWALTNTNDSRWGHQLHLGLCL